MGCVSPATEDPPPSVGPTRGGSAVRRKPQPFRPPSARVTLQSGVLPTNSDQRDLEYVSYVRPIDSFAGDFFEICSHSGRETWLFLGDVTGHGPRAGMVKLMAQSMLQALVKVRPGVSPRELNFLANKELHAKLKRLGEERYLSIVTICRRGDRILVSGSHDNMFVVRTATDTVEEVELTHFPFGLGLIGNLELSDFTECEIALGPQDILYVGTDGVTEAARDGDHAKGIFGDDGLKRFLGSIGHASLDEARDDLVDRLEAHTSGHFTDDVAFVMIRPLA